MSRKRYISTAISTDITICELAKTYSDFALLFYLFLIPHADDDGRIIATLDELKLLVVPGFTWKTVKDLEDALLGMTNLGLLEWSKEGNFIKFPDSFFRHQSYITTKRREESTLTNDQKIQRYQLRSNMVEKPRDYCRESAKIAKARDNCRGLPKIADSRRKSRLVLGLRSKVLGSKVSGFRFLGLGVKGLGKHLRQSPPEACQKNDQLSDSQEILEIPKTSADEEKTLKFSAVMKLWNAQLAPLGFPKVSKGSPGRTKHFGARLNDDKDREDIQWWTGLFDIVKQSKFLMESRNAGWMSIDWFLKENNLVKVTEGRYSGKSVVTDVYERASNKSPDDILSDSFAQDSLFPDGVILDVEAHERAGELKGG